jgi:hypothetical protein
VQPAPVFDATGSEPVVEQAPVQSARPKARRASPKGPAGPTRQFALSAKPARRAPPAVRVSPIHHFSSSDSDSRPYLLAALSLAVLALGSGTLLTVVSRVRFTRQGLL